MFDDDRTGERLRESDACPSSTAEDAASAPSRPSRPAVGQIAPVPAALVESRLARPLGAVPDEACSTTEPRRDDEDNSQGRRPRAVGRRRATPPPKAHLDRAGVIAAALAVVDAGGLQALSMRAVADALGVGTMSLYHHVDDKESLLEGVVEMVLAEVGVPAASAGPWPLPLRLLARSLHDAGRRHPNCVALLAHSGAPALGRWQAAVAPLVLRGGGPAGAVDALRAYIAYTVGFLIAAPEGTAGDLEAGLGILDAGVAGLDR